MAVATVPKGILQNGNVRLEVVKDYARRGVMRCVTQPEVALNYGLRSATLGQVLPFLAKDELYSKYKDTLGLALPFATKTHTAFTKIPLSDSIQTDGNELYLVDKSDGIEWRFPIHPDLLEKHEIKMSDSKLLFVVENNYTVRQDRPNSYTTVIENPLQDVRLAPIPEEGWTTADKLPVLFGDGAEPLKAYVWIHPNEVKVGLASAGGDGLCYVYHLGRVVVVSDGFLYRFGVLVEEGQGTETPKTR